MCKENARQSPNERVAQQIVHLQDQFSVTIKLPPAPVTLENNTDSITMSNRNAAIKSDASTQVQRCGYLALP